MAKLTLEIADTPAALARGLMQRSKLPDNSGMLFKFPRIIQASFWGKDTYIPLDIAFINNNKTITSIKSITPMSTRAVYSDGDCIMAIEANAGFFEKHNIKPGHRIILSENQNGSTEVVFEES